MSVTDAVTSSTGLPIGTWQLDPTNSSASFAGQAHGRRDVPRPV
jgi:hypothetical protein